MKKRNLGAISQNKNAAALATLHSEVEYPLSKSTTKTGKKLTKYIRYYLPIFLVKGEGFCNFGVRDKLNTVYAYFSIPSLQLSLKNKAGAISYAVFGLSRKLPNAPACLLPSSFIQFKKFAK